MKTTRKILDAAMVLLLPMLMAYSLIGEAFHEVAGTLMLALFILHHWMNRAWWKNLFKGQYSPQRVFSDGAEPLAPDLHDRPATVRYSDKQAPVYFSAD